MIFKTWLIDLTKIQGVVNQIKSIELWTNGATGLLNPNIVSNLSSAINGLNLQQAQLALSTRSLTQEQMHQVLVQAGLIASEDKIQAELLQSALAQSNLSAEKQKAILTDLGLINKRTLEVIATKACTKEELLNILATKGVTGANAEAIISTLGLANANEKTTLSFGLFTKATLAQLKAQLALMAVNPITWIAAIGAAIYGCVKAYDALTVSAKEAKEHTDELISTFNSAIDTANSHKQTIDEIKSRYEKLSKGVNSLGENVSLTTEEYSEYNDIVNQIADMFPTMVQGYTAEGNAILNLKGNVEALTEAYEAETQAAYNALIASGKDSDGNDIITDWKYSLSEDKGKGTNIVQAIKELQAFMTSDMDAEMYTSLREKAAMGIYDGMTDAEKLIAGSEFIPFKLEIDLDKDGTITDEELAKAKQSAKTLLQTYNAEIESDFSNVKTIANAYLMTNEDYKNLDEQSKAAASLLLNSISATSSTAQVLMTKTQEEIGEYVNYLVQGLSEDNPEVSNALINLITLDTQVLSPDEIKALVDSYISTIAGYLNEDENELKIQFGFDYVDDLEAQYQRAVDFAKDKFDGYDPTAFFKEHSINTQKEIDAWQEIAQGGLGMLRKLKRNIFKVQPQTLKTPFHWVMFHF